jgi:HSP20 family molecular chaperone IbpA
MANLTARKHVVSDLLDLKQEFERVFHHIFKHHVHPTAPAETFFAVVPPIETWIDAEDKEFHLSMPLPGTKPEALNITLQGNRLTFSDEHKEEEEKKTAKDHLQREFSYDRFTRTVTLPDGVDGEKMTAELKDGILEITAPIAAAALPKKIPVKKRRADQ